MRGDLRLRQPESTSPFNNLGAPLQCGDATLVGLAKFLLRVERLNEDAPLLRRQISHAAIFASRITGVTDGYPEHHDD